MDKIKNNKQINNKNNNKDNKNNNQELKQSNNQNNPSDKLKRYYTNINFFINKHKIIKETFKTIYKDTFKGFLYSIIILSIYNINKSEIIKSDNMYYFILGVDLVLYSIKSNKLQEYYNIIILLFSLTFKHIENENYFIIYFNSILEFINNTINNKIDKKIAYYNFCSIIFILICQLSLKKENIIHLSPSMDKNIDLNPSQNYQIIKSCGEYIGNILCFYEEITDDYNVYLDNKFKVFEILYGLNLMTSTIEIIFKQIDDTINEKINNHEI